MYFNLEMHWLYSILDIAVCYSYFLKSQKLVVFTFNQRGEPCKQIQHKFQNAEVGGISFNPCVNKLWCFFQQWWFTELSQLRTFYQHFTALNWPFRIKQVDGESDECKLSISSLMESNRPLTQQRSCNIVSPGRESEVAIFLGPLLWTSVYQVGTRHLTIWQ